MQRHHKQWFFHSAHRTRGTAEAPEYETKNRDSSRTHEVCVSSLTLPWQVRNFTSAKGNLTFTVVEDSSAVSWSFTVPEGTYTVSRLCAVLQAGFRALTPAGSPGITASSWTFTYDVGSNLVTVSWTAAVAVTITAATGWTQLGFTTAQQGVTQTTSVTALYHPNLLATQNVHVCLKSVDNSYPIQQSLNHVLLTVPVTVGHGEILLWENRGSAPKMWLHKQVSHLEFELRDDDGVILDNQGENWSLSLSVDHMRE